MSENVREKGFIKIKREPEARIVLCKCKETKKYMVSEWRKLRKAGTVPGLFLYQRIPQKEKDTMLPS